MDLATLQIPPDKRVAAIPALMRAKMAAKGGEKVNACPFGCQLEQIDEHGYCRHLIGFSNDQKTYEPFIWPRYKDGPDKGKLRGDRRVVQVERQMVPTDETDDEGVPLGLAWGKPNLPAVRPTDKLVQITTSYRVYRDVDKERAKQEKTKVKAARKQGKKALPQASTDHEPSAV